MSMDRFVKKRMFLFCLSLVCVLFVAISATYAFSINTTTDSSIVVSNDIKVEFINGNIISNNYPMTYNEGSINAQENIIRFKNTTNEKREFKLYVEDYQTTNNISLNKIYYKINDEIPRILGETNEPIYSGKLKGNKTDEIKVKIWVASELVTNLDQGKSSNLKFVIK